MEEAERLPSNGSWLRWRGMEKEEQNESDAGEGWREMGDDED